MSTRPCVSKTQKCGSRAHTRPRRRLDAKLSHKLYELRFVPKRVHAFPNKVVVRFGCNFSHVACCRKCLVGVVAHQSFLKSTKIIHTIMYMYVWTLELRG